MKISASTKTAFAMHLPVTPWADIMAVLNQHLGS
jgi:hypothetical protein